MVTHYVTGHDGEACVIFGAGRGKATPVCGTRVPKGEWSKSLFGTGVVALVSCARCKAAIVRAASVPVTRTVGYSAIDRSGVCLCGVSVAAHFDDGNCKRSCEEAR